MGEPTRYAAGGARDGGSRRSAGRDVTATMLRPMPNDNAGRAATADALGTMPIPPDPAPLHIAGQAAQSDPLNGGSGAGTCPTDAQICGDPGDAANAKNPSAACSTMA
jgi:hypothetical protein